MTSFSLFPWALGVYHFDVHEMGTDDTAVFQTIGLEAEHKTTYLQRFMIHLTEAPPKTSQNKA